MKKKTKILLLTLGLFIILFISFYFIFSKEQFRKSVSVEIEEAPILAGALDNLSGWAWSDNIGWISFNSSDCDTNNNGYRDAGLCQGDDFSTPSFDYGVNVNPGGIMSGYAWSDNIGWIDFNPNGPYPGTPNQGGRLDKNTGWVSGWARTEAGKSPEAGGWDGWMQLDLPDFPSQGVFAGPKNLTGECNWGGWVWGGDLDDDGNSLSLEGDEVVGWIDFSGVADDGSPYGVKGRGDDACATTVVPLPPNVPPIADISCEPDNPVVDNFNTIGFCKGYQGVPRGGDEDTDGVSDSLDIRFFASDSDSSPNGLTNCRYRIDGGGWTSIPVSGGACNGLRLVTGETLGVHEARIRARDGANAVVVKKIDFAILRLIKTDFQCSLTGAPGSFKDCGLGFKPAKKGDSIYLQSNSSITNPSEKDAMIDANFNGFQWTSSDGAFSNSSGSDPANSLTKFTPSGPLDFVKITFEVKDDLGFKDTETKDIDFREIMIWKEVIPR